MYTGKGTGQDVHRAGHKTRCTAGKAQDKTYTGQGTGQDVHRAGHRTRRTPRRAQDKIITDRTKDAKYNGQERVYHGQRHRTRCTTDRTKDTKNNGQDKMYNGHGTGHDVPRTGHRTRYTDWAQDKMYHKQGMGHEVGKMYNGRTMCTTDRT